MIKTVHSLLIRVRCFSCTLEPLWILHITTKEARRLRVVALVHKIVAEYIDVRAWRCPTALQACYQVPPYRSCRVTPV